MTTARCDAPCHKRKIAVSLVVNRCATAAVDIYLFEMTQKVDKFIFGDTVSARESFKFGDVI